MHKNGRSQKSRRAAKSELSKDRFDNTLRPVKLSMNWAIMLLGVGVSIYEVNSLLG